MCALFVAELVIGAIFVASSFHRKKCLVNLLGDLSDQLNFNLDVWCYTTCKMHAYNYFHYLNIINAAVEIRSTADS